MKFTVIAGLTLASCLLLFCAPASAGINLGNTRVVLAAPSKEASVVLKNNSPEDIMVQSWIEAGDKLKDVPFVITPVLERLRSEQQQTLRVLYYGKGLPTDKESVLWLNVQEVPQKPKEENTLQIAVRQRIKLFYRPAGLPGKIEEVPQQLKWRFSGTDGKTSLEVTNPSRFHVSFAAIKLHIGRETYSAPIDMLAPSSTSRVEIQGLPKGTLAGNTKVEFEVIGDYGGMAKYDSAISD